MQLHRETSTGTNKLVNCSTHGITINDTLYNQTIIVTAQQLITKPLPQSLSELTPDSLQPIIQLKPELLLIGTASDSKQLPLNIRSTLHQHGIALESMPTASACRTYIVLESEGRDMAALLFVA